MSFMNNRSDHVSFKICDDGIYPLLQQDVDRIKSGSTA